MAYEFRFSDWISYVCSSDQLIRIRMRKIHTVPQAVISPRNLENMRGTILLTLWDRGLFLRPVAREFHATGLHLGHIGLQHLGAGQALGIEVLGPGQGGVGDRRRPLLALGGRDRKSVV